MSYHKFVAWLFFSGSLGFMVGRYCPIVWWWTYPAMFGIHAVAALMERVGWLDPS